MSPGFTVVLGGGGVTCEVAESPLVGHARDGALAAVLMGRLYYRDRSRPAGRLSDAAFALDRYRRAGEGGLERLEGDFALAVWDAHAGRLVALRDPNGAYPLYWFREGDRFAVGTGVGPLLRRLGRWEVDPEYLAEFLTAPGFGHFEPEHVCAYRGLNRVPAGALVSVREATGSVARRRYWDWSESAEDPGTDRTEILAALAADRIREAVRERVVGPTAAHLSGGMDSTAVATLADLLVRSGERPGPLHAVSLVYEQLPVLSRERPYVEAGIGRLGAATAHRLVSDDRLDFDDYATAPTGDEPFQGLWWVQNEQAVASVLSDVGASTLLTGYGADVLFERHPHHLADLIRRGRLLSAWAEAGRWSAHRNASRWDILRNFGYGTFHWYRRLFGGSAGMADMPGAAVPPWVRPEFDRRHGLGRRLAEQDLRSRARSSDRLRTTTLSALASQAGDPFGWAVMVPRGVHTAHPFQDPRVVGLGLGILDRVAPQPGPMKPVLSAAMADVLPPAITGRRSKGFFDELYYRGLARNLRTVERVVREADVDDLGVFDKEALLSRVEEATLGGRGSQKLIGMELALDAIRWLSDRDARRLAEPGPVTVVTWPGRSAEVPAH